MSVLTSEYSRFDPVRPCRLLDRVLAWLRCMRRRWGAGMARILGLGLSLAGVTAPAAQLSLGIHPYLPPTELVQRFTPLASYLARRTGHSFDLRISSDYATHIDAIGRDELDVAFLGPASYVKMVATYGPKPILARLEVAGRPAFRGAIICRADSPLQGLADLQGTRFAFGDRASTMSHLVPRYVMWGAGVSVDDLAEHRFLDSHHNVALGVLMGEFDAGAVKEEVFEHYRARGLKLLAETPPISEHLLVARADLPAPLVAALRKALYGLRDDPSGAAVMEAIKPGVTGMIPARDEDYANLRSILATLSAQGVEF